MKALKTSLAKQMLSDPGARAILRTYMTGVSPRVGKIANIDSGVERHKDHSRVAEHRYTLKTVNKAM
jgi:hypothetical protein